MIRFMEQQQNSQHAHYSKQLVNLKLVSCSLVTEIILNWSQTSKWQLYPFN